MTKTVKQIIDEFIGRNKKQFLGRVIFFKNGRLDGYSNVANLYRDGVKVEKLELDSSSHKYEFDARFQVGYYPEKYEWTHYVFIAQIVEFAQKIDE